MPHRCGYAPGLREEERRKTRFRGDLYYRLFGLPIELPPLRERGKDIIMLAKYFLESFVRKTAWMAG
ncbi:MAG: hypothetical protein R3B47_15465 [Bacteroidia bacterium]